MDSKQQLLEHIDNIMATASCLRDSLTTVEDITLKTTVNDCAERKLAALLQLGNFESTGREVRDAVLRFEDLIFDIRAGILDRID